MYLIGMLMLVACTGVLYAAYLLKKEREKRVADLITALEREQQGGLDSGETKKGHRFMPAAMLAGYEQKLLWAGRPFGLDARQFVTLKLAGAAVLPAGVTVLSFAGSGSTTVVLALVAALAGFILPDAWLSSILSRRQRLVAEELPLFADLIATAISAGLPLTEAVRRVAADAPGIVAREFLRSVQEMAAGKPRAQAWRDLVNRVPGDELRAIVNAIMQAEQYGTSVAEIIRYQVQQIRLFKQQEAQRLAQAATVKMRIPMFALEPQPTLPCYWG